MSDFHAEFLQAFRTGLAAAIKDRMTGYGSPIDKMLSGVIEAQSGDLRTLLAETISAALGDANFRETIAAAVRQKLARVLIDRFGGELEKQVNQLKSDPVTRAKITLAIEEVVRQRIA